MKKIFILDTNVMLHDYECIFKFEENDLIIPIVALEELDNNKNGHNQINYNSREFARILDEVIDGKDISQGILLGENLGKLYIRNIKYSKTIKETFNEITVDHKILSLVEEVSKENPKTEVILVSKDINLRLKAKSLGLKSQDYLNDQIHNIDELMKKTILNISDVPAELIEELYSNNTIEYKKIYESNGLKGDPIKNILNNNQYIIIKNNDKSILVKHQDGNLERIEKKYCYGISPRNAEQTLAMNSLLNPDIKVVALTGNAGCGKTLITLAAALQQLSLYDKIYLARPVISLPGEDIGHIPGDVGQKMSVWMSGYYDNLAVIKNNLKKGKKTEKIDDLIKNETIVISPLSYIRGRSLPNIFFITDECQNLTPHEVKTIITRIGEDSKIVMLGDIDQIDSPWLNRNSNGLSYLCEKMTGQKIFSHIHLTKSERSEVAEIGAKIL